MCNDVALGPERARRDAILAINDTLQARPGAESVAAAESVIAKVQTWLEMQLAASDRDSYVSPFPPTTAEYRARQNARRALHDAVPSLSNPRSVHAALAVVETVQVWRDFL